MQQLLASKKEEPLKGVDPKADKKQLLVANQRLIGRALLLEKQWITTKLQLRLSHDHRDFCKVKKRTIWLDFPAGWDPNEDWPIRENKAQIKNLQRQIEHEKKRLKRLRAPVSLGTEAAEMIQRCWRGFAARKRLRLQRECGGEATHDFETEVIVQ
jgi:hypothetical protein